MPAPRKARPDKSANRPVTLNLPGAGLRQLPAGEAVKMASGWLQQGNTAAVVPVMQQLVQQLPGYEAAWLRLFDALHRTGDFVALKNACQACLQQKPRSVPALVSLSVACRYLQEYGAAEEAIDKAAKLDPRNPEVLNHQGVILKETGQHEQALVVFNRCLALRPDLASAIWNRADLCGPLGEADLARIGKSALDEKRPARHRAMLHYALARSYEQARDYDNEFSHIDAGAKLMHELLNYDHAAELKQISSVSRYFPNDPGSITDGDNGPVPIFICGLPRSGTTLVEQILSSHPLVRAGDELNDLPLACSQYLRRRGNNKTFPDWVSDVPDEDWSAIGKAYLQSTHGLQSTGWFTDKNLQNYKAIGVIRRALPQAKIIVCRRDPLDNLLGCLRQYFSDGLMFTYSQQELADIWMASDALIRHWHETDVPLLEVSYESLVKDPEKGIRALLDYVGLPWDNACLSFYENKRAVRTTSATQVRQPLSDSSVGRWRRYERYLQPMIEALGLKEEVIDEG